jgi:YrbI family 3-deoxy-D-manno-octulosonate 8-phosphate phosphatase
VIRNIPEEIRAVVFDFDGVMTDNRVLVCSDGTEGVMADRGDGMGISLLRRTTELHLLVLSTETDPVVKHRCNKLHLACITGIENKLPSLQDWLVSISVDAAECVYVGNDINDVSCMEYVGWAVAPADAYPAALSIADLVLTRPGGRGAVRELAELLVAYPGTARFGLAGPAGSVSESSDEEDIGQSG